MSYILYMLATIFTVFWYVHRCSNKQKIKLPGPWGLPFIGSVLQMDRRFYKQFETWTKKYGNMFTVQLGRDRTVVVSDPKMAKEMFSSEMYTGRMQLDGVSLFENEPHLGLVNSVGESWEQLRRFTLRQLRDFGFGKSQMEALIMDELKEFNDGLKEAEGTSIDNVKHRFSLAVVNALWTIVGGERFSHQDKKLGTLVRQITEAFDETAKTGGILLFAPWVKYILPEISRYNLVRRVMENLKSFVVQSVNSHKISYSADNSPRDFIDVFLGEMSTTHDPNSSFYKQTGEKQLVACVADLFFAGSDTTSSTLNWAILYLAKWQNVQRKFQKEIKHVIGNKRFVSLADRPNMPYTQGLIEEILRLSSIIPLGVPHRVVADTEYKGLFLPKNTTVLVNLYCIHHNPDVWEDPFVLKPERFLIKNETVFKKNDNLLPFSVGKRQCLGETLARSTIFLFLTNTFQQWDISLDSNFPEPTIEPGIGFTLNPEKYHVIVNKLVI